MVVRQAHQPDLRFMTWRYFLIFCMMVIIPVTLFSQQEKPIRVLPTQNSSPGVLGEEPIINTEHEKTLQEYEKLIKKYPDKKELYYNLGNLNYLSGDRESALQNYRNSLIDTDPKSKANTLYNMGNTLYQMGDLQKSVELFKEALTLSPEDEDIRYNYELSKRMLEMQPPQEYQDQNQDGKEGDDEQKQDSESGEDGDEEDSEDQQKSENSDENEEKNKVQEQSQPQEGDEKNEQEQNTQHPETQTPAEIEKQLGKEEAEAILKALKADENNLKPKKYKAVGRLKLEKDW